MTDNTDHFFGLVECQLRESRDTVADTVGTHRAWMLRSACASQSAHSGVSSLRRAGGVVYHARSPERGCGAGAAGKSVSRRELEMDATAA